MRAWRARTTLPELAQPPTINERKFMSYTRENPHAGPADDRGRRWYHVRLEPRGRADVLGFNFSWWLVIAFVVLVLLPW
jgi:hypothetical protein